MAMAMAKEERMEIEIIMEKIWVNLPQEIIIEILSFLPANSLLCSFKFVCKAWCNLIHHPVFIKMHLNRRRRRSKFNNTNKGSLLRTFESSGNALFQRRGRPSAIVAPIVAPPPTNIDFDFDLWEESSRLVGSCDGLLCLSVNNDESIIILNPSTRKYKISPKQPIQRTSSTTFHKPATYGFGCYYNSISTTNIDDEYKVVRIAHFYPLKYDDYSFQFQIDIYSMGSNSWRRWRRDEGIPCEISQEQSGVFLNGGVHWMGCKLRQTNVWYWNSIVSFNIRDEEFRQIPMPPCADVVVNDNGTILMNVRGCLGKVYFSHTEMMDIELEIWVMKEYGVRESWTKEFVIRTSDADPPRELSGLSIFSRYMTCFLTGGQIQTEVRVCAGKAASFYNARPRMKGIRCGRRVLYNMNKKKIDGDFVMVDMPYEPRDDQVDYIETLVSLKSSLLPSSNYSKVK